LTRSVAYVVAKAPRAGAVKTRLFPTVTPDEAANLARSFLLDTLECVRAVDGVEARIVCRDRSDARLLADIVGADVVILRQSQPGLGAALEDCFDHGSTDGFERVAVLGSDSPTLPASIIRQAFDLLDVADVSIGPTEDGGYYVLAAHEPHPILFRDMVWGNPAVLGETLARCTRAGLRAAVLRPWFDVDDGADLLRLRDELERGEPRAAPHTRAALAALALDLPRAPAETHDVIATGWPRSVPSTERAG
jgi:rSAM/selenodomain-associated transferase 1